MKKQITLTLNTSSIIQDGKPAVGFNLSICDECNPEDVRLMVNSFMNWYISSATPPQPPPKKCENE